MNKQRFTDVDQNEEDIIKNIIGKKPISEIPNNNTINDNIIKQRADNPAQYYADNFGSMSVNLDDVK